LPCRFFVLRHSPSESTFSGIGSPQSANRFETFSRGAYFLKSFGNQTPREAIAACRLPEVQTFGRNSRTEAAADSDNLRIRIDILKCGALLFRVMDFKDQLRRQLLFLQNSCQLYDEGHFEEAIRLAVALRVMLHDTDKSTSLLNHLGAKSVLVLSTAELPKKHQDHHLALVTGLLKVSEPTAPKASYQAVPVLADPLRRDFVPFHAWWRKETIIKLRVDASLNRRDLILDAANKDGGAHVDAVLPHVYDKTRLGAGMEIEIEFKTGPTKVKMPHENVHYASLRQIAYEVLNSPALTGLTK
jgi:hypothetical protein